MDTKIKRRICLTVILIIVILVIHMLGGIRSHAEETAGQQEANLNLYARAAVLMDGESGRILYEKNGREIMPMASTTKIMTCIIALEYGNLEDITEVSAYAAGMPKVRLGMRQGEYYKLKDLLFSLMLESHNDSAVAIAEHVGGSVEAFAGMMNQKARDIGCFDTYFITPNGLDATATLINSEGVAEIRQHATTAADLAAIMSYCIKDSPKKNEFLALTQVGSYQFKNRVKSENGGTVKGSRSFQCINHNAFLNMMEGAVSGKTGFTSKAGYCYVGALERDGKTLVVALLACGWPNHKTYKWSDTRELMEMGLNRYHYVNLDEMKPELSRLQPLSVAGGQTRQIDETAMVEILPVTKKENTVREINGVLIREDEEIEIVYDIVAGFRAPVAKGERAGTIKYRVGDAVWKEETLVTAGEVLAIDYWWSLKKIIEKFLLEHDT